MFHLGLALLAAFAEPFMLSFPAATSHFSRPAEAADASGRLQGRLVLDDSSGAATRVLRDRYGRAAELKTTFASDPLPDFELDFIQAGDALLPLRPGVIEGDHPAWTLIVSPGRAWAERGGANMAAIPFALQERDANCTHYGLLLFRYRPEGSVGDAAWQVGSETCAYFQFDGWGTGSVRYEPRALALNDAIARNEQRSARSLEELVRDYPGLTALKLPAPVQHSDLTVFGFAVDGRHYSSACPTRFGPHPFCDSLPLPSYSLAKTLFGGLALMRAELEWPGTMQRRVADLVPECAGWGEVTLGDALDMATGRYSSSAYEADENGPATVAFLQARRHRERLTIACNSFQRRESPGKRFVYHTTDSYVIGAALSALAAPGDIHRDLLVEPIWTKIGLGPLSAYTRRTRDAARQPFVGYGLTFERDDLARIARYLQSGGFVDGTPLVDPAALATGMQRNPADRGLEAGGADFRYQNGFWARNVASLVGCADPLWVPFLSGYCGISLVLFPNGVSYYVVSDGFTYDWRGAATAAHAIRDLCAKEART